MRCRMQQAPDEVHGMRLMRCMGRFTKCTTHAHAMMPQGLELLVHVDGVTGPETDGWRALTALAASSALTLTEEMPTSPYAQWTHVRPPASRLLHLS